MSGDLAAFLLAQIAEDEETARAAAEVNPPSWRVHRGDTGLRSTVWRQRSMPGWSSTRC